MTEPSSPYLHQAERRLVRLRWLVVGATLACSVVIAMWAMVDVLMSAGILLLAATLVSVSAPVATTVIGAAIRARVVSIALVALCGTACLIAFYLAAGVSVSRGVGAPIGLVVVPAFAAIVGTIGSMAGLVVSKLPGVRGIMTKDECMLASSGRCRQCGYSLAGLTNGVCPECGEALGI